MSDGNFSTIKYEIEKERKKKRKTEKSRKLDDMVCFASLNRKVGDKFNSMNFWVELQKCFVPLDVINEYIFC